MNDLGAMPTSDNMSLAGFEELYWFVFCSSYSSPSILKVLCLQDRTVGGKYSGVMKESTKY